MMSNTKPILVTGCSSGIGRAMALKLAKDGNIVYATARNQKDLDELSKIPNIYSCKLDVREPEDIRNLKQFVHGQGRGLYAIVNNAGIAEYGPLVELDEEELNNIFTINLCGPIQIINSLIDYLIESKGRIINIGSIAGILTPKFMGAYSMTKHALAAVSGVYRNELSKFGIRVSIVEPGDYQSNITQVPFKAGKDRDYQYYQKEMSTFFDNNFSADRTELPKPDNVVTTVEHALFSENPRLHYLICDQKEEVLWVMKQTINNLMQYRMDNDQYVSKDQLAKLFMTKLDR